MNGYPKIEDTFDSLKEYLLLNFELLKLETISRFSNAGAIVSSTLIVGLTVFMFVFTVSIGLGFYISALIGNTYSGFIIIAAFYFLLAFILLIGRKLLIERPLRDKIVEQIMKNKP